MRDSPDAGSLDIPPKCIKTEHDDSYHQRSRHISAQSASSGMSSSHESLHNLSTNVDIKPFLQGTTHSERQDSIHAASTSSSTSTSVNDPMLSSISNDGINCNVFNIMTPTLSSSPPLLDNLVTSSNSLDTPLLNASPKVHHSDGFMKGPPDPGPVRRSPPPPNVTLNPEKHKRNTFPQGITELQTTFIFI